MPEQRWEQSRKKDVDAEMAALQEEYGSGRGSTQHHFLAIVSP